MSRGRIALGVCISVLVVVAVGALTLDRLVAAAVERGAETALGTETRLASARVRLATGECLLRGLEVANPPGFESPNFLTLEQGEIQVELGSLWEDPWVIPRLALKGVEVSLERNGDGRTNYGMILEHAARGEAPTSAEEPAAEGRGLVIRELVVEEISARVVLHPGVAPIEIEVPEIRLTNVGSREKGALMTQLARVVASAVLRGVVKSGAGVPRALRAELGRSLRRLSTAPATLPKNLADIERTGRAVLRGGKEALDGVRGLFGRKDP